MGVATAFSMLWLLPRLRYKAEVPYQPLMRWKHPNPFIDYFFFLRFVSPKGWYQYTGHTYAYPKFRLAYKYGAVGITWIVVLIVTADLLTSGGFVKPFSLSAIYHDLFFARVNGVPDGAHTLTYLLIPATIFYVTWKFKDIFLGLVSGAFIVGLHEAIWTPVYYSAYYQFLSWSEAGAVLKDVSSMSMYLLFIYTFARYKGRPFKLSDFKAVSIAFFMYLVWWFILPHALDPSRYPWFPITTINNYAVSQSPYLQTALWADPLTNIIEVVSWILLFGMVIKVCSLKR